MTATHTYTTCGTEVYTDRSGGQGHCWRLDPIPPDVLEEIAAEILDGGREACEGYRATNGQWYRW